MAPTPNIDGSFIGLDLAEKEEISVEWARNPANAYFDPTKKIHDTYKKGEHQVTLRSVRNKVIADCGHKVDVGDLPKNKCKGCWGAFFFHNEKMTVANMQMLRAGRAQEVTAALGSKYTKMLAAFIQVVIEAGTAAGKVEPKVEEEFKPLQIGNMKLSSGVIENPQAYLKGLAKEAQLAEQV